MKTKSASRKEELAEQIKVLRTELGEIEDAERMREAEALVGRCFKYRNCYSGPEKPSDYWWLYCLVTHATDEGPKGLRFQIDKDGKIEVESGYWIGPFKPMNGWTEITGKELDAAWMELLARADAVAPTRRDR